MNNEFDNVIYYSHKKLNSISIYLRYFILFSFMISATFLLARNENAGTNGFAFMKVNYSARAMGMANAFSALANDADAVFFNPAGLANMTGDQVKTTYMNYIEGLQGGSAVFTAKLPTEWTVAPFINFLVSDEMPKTFETNLGYGGQNGTFNTFSMVIGAGFGRNVNHMFDVGFNLKYFYENLDQSNASAVAADFAVLHQTENDNLKIGAAIQNLGWQIDHYTEAKYEEGMPLVFVGSASYRLGEKGYLNFDLVRPFDNDFYGRLGVEFYYNQYFTIRGGLDSRMNDYRTSQSVDVFSGLTMGLGFNWNKQRIDYAISSMGGLGLVNQISLAYLF